MEREEQQAADQAEGLEEQGDRLEARKERLEEDVQDLKHDWERKKQASDVPGAQEPDEGGDPPPSEAQITPGD